MSAQDLIVYKKTEDLFYKVYPTFRNFPKSEQHSMCRFLKENFTELLTCLSLANSVKSKRKIYLQEADARLTSLTTLVKLSHRQRYFSHGFFEIVDVSLTEIKKLLVGWIKSTSNPNRESSFSKVK